MGAGKSTRIATGLVASVLAAVALSPGMASADVERNDYIFDPEGPIAGGQDLTGTVAEGDTDDWYLLYAEGQQQLHLRHAPDPTGCVSISLADDDGDGLPPDYTSPPDVTTRFFVHVQRNPFACPSGSAGSYSFKVDPAEGIVPGPGKTPVRAVTEPNDTLETAFGPLLSETWHYSVLETANDRDWLIFYTAPGRQRIDVQTVSYGGLGCSQSPTLTDAAGKTIEAAFPVGVPVVKHIRRTLRGGARLYMRNGAGGNTGCVGAVTVTQVGPAQAVLSGSEVSAACRAAGKSRKRWSRRLTADIRALKRARSTPVRRALKRKVKRDRRQLRAARRLVAAYCS